MNPWDTLGVADDVAVRDLRRRYAALIKEFRPETHPQEFARIREAYEIALEVARRREAWAEDEAQAAVAVAVASEEIAHAASDEDVALASSSVPPAVTPPAADPEPTVATDSDEAIENRPAIVAAARVEPESRSPEPVESSADEPGLGALFQRFHAEAGAATGSDDEEHLPALRALLRAASRATLDDGQALEFAFLRWFLGAENPPLTLMFEVGRAYAWHGREQRLSTWLAPIALGRLALLLTLSRDLVYARHFAGNAALRRLHQRDARFVAPVWRPAALEALQWAARWQDLCERASGPALRDSLNATALRRARGRQLQSTEIVIGLLAAALIVAATSDIVVAALLGLLATGLFYALRRAAIAVRDAAKPRWLQGALDRLVEARSRIAAAIGAVCLVGTIALIVVGDDAALHFGGLVLLTLAALPAAWGWWRFVAFVELASSALFAWRGDLDRLELERWMQRPVHMRPEAAMRAPFGDRLAWHRRLRGVGAATRLRRVEIAQHQRPALLVSALVLRRGAGTSLRRKLCVGGWMAFVVLRVLHGAGAF